MSWLGLRHKGVEPLFPMEWNAVVDGLDLLKQYTDDCIAECKQPTKLDTATKTVSTTPIPLSDIDLYVKRIHIKLPSWALYLLYVGSDTKQDYILEPGDSIPLEIDNAKKVYVRSTGDVTITILYELP